MKKAALGIVIVGLIAAFFIFDLNRFFTLEQIKLKQAEFASFKVSYFWLTCLIFSAVYIGSTALSLPGASLLTLLGGGLFGLGVGTVLVSFSSTMGATLAFLTSRFLLKDTVEQKFKSTFDKINQGVEKEGAFYLFSLRLIPLFPFFLVNLLMGLTKIKTPTYMWVSALGMLPGTLAYVNAGTRLSEITSTKGLLSFKLIASFALLGVVPFASKKLIDLFRTRRAKHA